MQAVKDFIIAQAHPDYVSWLSDEPSFALVCESLAAFEARKVRYQPALHDLVKPLKMPPRAVRVVALGQDPYTSAGHPTGLAFANAPRVNRPFDGSLRIIMEAAGTTDSTLMSWFGQGVLLLNVVWTSTISGLARDPAHRFWEPFTRALLAHIDAVAKPIPMLWGNDAKALADLFTHPALIYHHPSGNAEATVPAERRWAHNANFRDCNKLFEAAGLPPIIWTTRPLEFSWSRYLVFTDGACTANGKPNAKAGLGAVALERVTERGNVSAEGITYRVLARTNMPFPAHKGPQTNQRAELLGVWRGLEMLRGAGVAPSPVFALESETNASGWRSAFDGIAVVTDSAYSINILVGANAAHVNLDLFEPVKRAVGEWRPTLWHTDGHMLSAHLLEHELPTCPGNRPSPRNCSDHSNHLGAPQDPYEHFFNAWNHEADRLATNSLH